MKYLNNSLGRGMYICMALMCTLAYNSFAQCSLSCNGSTQVSLSSTCDAVITPNMILSDNGLSCAGGTFEVTVEDDYGAIPGGDRVNRDYMGLTLKASVRDTKSGNSCWGYIIIEDKLGPMITDCPMNVQIRDCIDMNILTEPIFKDNCDGDLEAVLLTEEFITDCHPNLVKIVKRTYSAKDKLGNISANNCSITYRLRRINPTRVRWPDSLTVAKTTALSCGQVSDFDSNNNGRIDEGEIDPLVSGFPFYIVLNPGGVNGRDTVDLYPYPDVYCNTVVTFDDTVLPKIGCTQKVMRRWLLSEWHCDGEVQVPYIQIIEITDDAGPNLTVDPDGRCIINGKTSIELTTNTLLPAGGGTYGDFTCGAIVNLPIPEATDNCSVSPRLDATYNNGHHTDYAGEDVTLPMGTSVVLYTVYDGCYNSSTCHLAVDIVDNTPPVAICDQNTTVGLTSGGKAVVAAESFNDGSYDDCKIHCALVRRMNSNPECDKVPEFCDLTYLGTYGPDGGDQSYYYLSNYRTSSKIAKARAAAYGGSLAILNSADEDEWLLENVRNRYAEKYWIGLKRFGNSFNWDNHDPLSYRNFSGDTIPEVGGDCVLVDDDGEWIASECSGDSKGAVSWRYVFKLTKSPDYIPYSLGVQYCCDDAQVDNSDHMVVFRVVDFYGNYNDCMVNLEVQDKSSPTLICPPDRTVDCGMVYDPNNMDLHFGELQMGESCGAGAEPPVLEEELDECGAGYIKRTWRIGSSECKQIITFKNDDIFDGDDIVCPKVNINVNECSDPEEFGPDVTGKPEFTPGKCNFVGTDYDDQVFQFNSSSGDACFKILREWEIIDWCQVDPIRGTYRSWNCSQVIKITDPIPPSFEVGCRKLDPFVTFDSDCQFGEVELGVSASDICTDAENLSWSYSVFANRTCDNYTYSQISADTIATGEGDTITLKGKFPVGNHVVVWTFYDGCGNASSCCQEFVVANGKAATAYCINGLAVDLMKIDVPGGTTGMIELWANDFDAGSSHPCDYPVHLSFSSDIEETNRVFDCNNVGNQLVEIWASVITPSNDTIQTFCSTFIDIQDNMSACQGLRPGLMVEGNIYTEDVQFVEDVQVTLEGSPMVTSTSTYGEYAFPDMPEGGHYVVSPFSDINPLNGVSTLDLIMIQRHILGLESFDSPYKYIAADIDRNSEINGLDLVELRKLILGVYSSFPENTSWRFVDRNYAFNVDANPLAQDYDEEYQISQLDSDMTIDFIAVKTGDVNGSVELGMTDNTSSKNQNNILTYEDLEVTQGQVVKIPFSMVGKDQLNGFQLNINYDPSRLIILEVNRADGSLDNTNYVISDSNLKLSWDGESDNNVFELLAIVKTNGDLTGAFNLAQDRLHSEVYTENGEVISPSIISSKVLTEGDYLLVEQNMPNPFNNSTSIKFTLPNRSNVDVLVHDLDGKLIYKESNLFNKGENSLVVSKNQLGASGVYYLTLSADKNSQTIKMILVD